MDGAFDDSDMEEETDGVLGQILDEIGLNLGSEVRMGWLSGALPYTDYCSAAQEHAEGSVATKRARRRGRFC